MRYYYNYDGVFSKVWGKEYVSKKTALNRLKKEGHGAVFDDTGNLIQAAGGETDAPEAPAELGIPYYVTTTCDALRVRSCPDPTAPVVGFIRNTVEKQKYRVTKEKDGWGMIYVPQLNSIGWIALAYTKKV
jgi:hypothetical protein